MDGERSYSARSGSNDVVGVGAFPHVFTQPPLPLPIQVLSNILGCTLDQGISIYELIK